MYGYQHQYLSDPKFGKTYQFPDGFRVSFAEEAAYQLLIYKQEEVGKPVDVWLHQLSAYIDISLVFIQSLFILLLCATHSSLLEKDCSTTPQHHVRYPFQPLMGISQVKLLLSRGVSFPVKGIFERRLLFKHVSLLLTLLALSNII